MTASKVDLALRIATDAHQGQFRKGSNVPYIFHPVAVCRSLMEYGCSAELAAAALLHDVLEDTEYTEAGLSCVFNIRVIELIKNASEPNKNAEWEDRKMHTVTHLAKSEDKELVLLVMADKLDNLSQLSRDLKAKGETYWTTFKRGRDLQEWYFSSLRGIFEDKLSLDNLLLNQYIKVFNEVFVVR